MALQFFPLKEFLDLGLDKPKPEVRQPVYPHVTYEEIQRILEDMKRGLPIIEPQPTIQPWIIRPGIPTSPYTQPWTGDLPIQPWPQPWTGDPPVNPYITQPQTVPYYPNWVYDGPPLNIIYTSNTTPDTKTMTINLQGQYNMGVNVLMDDLPSKGKFYDNLKNITICQNANLISK